jgi:hypothetical protein
MAKNARLGKPGIFELSRYRALRYSNIAYWIYYVKDKGINQQPLRALPLFQ